LVIQNANIKSNEEIEIKCNNALNLLYYLFKIIKQYIPNSMSSGQASKKVLKVEKRSFWFFSRQNGTKYEKQEFQNIETLFIFEKIRI